MVHLLDDLQLVVKIVMLVIILLMISGLTISWFMFIKDMLKSLEQMKKEDRCSCGNCYVTHHNKNEELQICLCCKGCGCSTDIYDLEDDDEIH